MAESSSQQVLVIEDEVEIRELISMLLLRQGYRVQVCASAVEGFTAIQKNNFDLIVLDWMLPQKDGIEMSGVQFLEKTQMSQRPPVLMVTAKTEPQDIVQGLESGADDYITKPFDPSVLVARAKALLRRSVSKQQPSNKALKVADVSLNTDSHEVYVKNEKLHLTPSEFKILASLMQELGKVLTRDQLIQNVQGEGISVTGRTIDTHVFSLRKKMGDSQEIIETIRGVGYRVKGD